MLKELHDAVAPAFDTEGKEIPPRRKDMVGFPETVDRKATLALLNNSIRKSNKSSGKSESVLDKLDLELRKTPSTRPYCTASLRGR